MTGRVVILCLVLLAGCARGGSGDHVDTSALPDRFVNSLGIEMVLVHGGRFEMGRDLDFGPGLGLHDGPRHPVELSPYYIARSEVTRGQYRLYVEAMGRDVLPELDQAAAKDRPIYAAPWAPCARFCEWLGEVESTAYRLPTEAEWEYACRAGTDTKWWWGDREICGVYNHMEIPESGEAYQRGTSPAGALPANPWGLYDMYGNAMEWCQDWHSSEYYALSPLRNPTGPIQPDVHRRKVMRGGWYRAAPIAGSSYFRVGMSPDEALGGIRLVLPVRPGFRLPVGAQVSPARPDAVPGQAPAPDPGHFLRAQTVQLSGTTAMEMLQVEPGRFLMGSPADEPGRATAEGPVTDVVIDYPFLLSRYEVTNGQWAAISGKAMPTGVDLDEPVRNVTWESLWYALPEFTKRERTAGRLGADEVYRLPYEYEWEYAYRAGSQSRFPHGDDVAGLATYAWYDILDGPRLGGGKHPNAWGFYDMGGNLCEWTFNPPFNLPGGTVKGQTLPTIGPTRLSIAKGGAWNFGAIGVRPAARQLFWAAIEIPWIGFRLVRVTEEAEGQD